MPTLFYIPLPGNVVEKKNLISRNFCLTEAREKKRTLFVHCIKFKMSSPGLAALRNILSPADKLRRNSVIKNHQRKLSILESMNPIIMSLRILSICPIRFNNNTHSYTHSWKSFPAIFSLGLLIASIYSAIQVLQTVHWYAEEWDVSGTDLYTSVGQLYLVIFSSLLVIGAGNFNGPKYCRGSLHNLSTLSVNIIIGMVYRTPNVG